MKSRSQWTMHVKQMDERGLEKHFSTINSMEKRIPHDPEEDELTNFETQNRSWWHIHICS